MRERGTRSRTIIAAAGLALCAGAGAALGQGSDTTIAPPAAQEAPPATNPLDITGRDFAGIEFAPAAVVAASEFAANRAYAWTETDEVGRSVQRLLLEGDVTVRLGLHRFVAARAVVWIQQLDTADATGEDEGGLTRQIAVYFDRVSDPGAEAGVGQTADRLLVTGVLAGPLTLRVDVTETGRPRGGEGGAFVQEGEARLARFLLRQIGAVEFVESAPEDVFARARRAQQERMRPGQSQPYEPGSALDPLSPRPEPRVVLDPALRLPPIFADDGTMVFSMEEVEVARGEASNTLIITGGLVAQHIDPLRDRTLQISAQRAVVFTAPGPLPQIFQYEAEDIYGIYLEGDVVATDGNYTLRGKQVYYDVQNNTAHLADAVFFTYDEERGMPLYVRAKAMRQEAENRFSATGATLSSASFADPQFAIGASEITVTRERKPTDAGGTTTVVDAEDLTIKALGVPFFYWPRFQGELANLPLRNVSVENSSGSGTAIKTAWDVFGVLGLRPPTGVTVDLLLDGYFQRGVAIGTDASWFTGNSAGGVLAYLLPSDSGEDQLTSGAEIERDNETRSLVLAEHRWALADRWTLFLEGAFASDENFVDSFFEPLAETRREFTNSAYLRYLDDGSALTLQGKGSIMDFTPNEYLLQSQGYDVEKLPEIAYWRFADDLLGDAAPGAVTYSSEIRYSRMRINLTEPTAAELGFDTAARSQAAFGINPQDSLADRLRLIGIETKEVNRFDTRHELSSAFYLGPVKVNPFVTGRITAYDNTFDEFSPADNADDHARYFGAAGTRLSTSITRVNNDFESRLFDLHRIRHIVEPNVTVWSSGANLDQRALPVYDDRVESLATGSAVRFGVDQTWQTMRGGPGRYRSVDFLKIRQNFTFSSQDADRESPIGRFFDFRPEYSLLGDYSTTDVVWHVSDPVALSFNMVYDLEGNQPARTSAGALVQHSEAFGSYIEARYINALESTYLNFGANYQLTRKYRLESHATYDTDFNEFQSISGVVRRRYPEATLGMVVNFNQITDETSFGFVFEPVGIVDDSAARLRRLGSERGRVRPVGG